MQVGPVQPANLVPFTTISFPGEITDLEMSPTRSALVATSDGGNVARVFDPTTYQQLQDLSLMKVDDVFAASFGGTGTRLAVAADDEVVSIFNASTYAYERMLPPGNPSGGMQFLAVAMSTR